MSGNSKRFTVDGLVLGDTEHGENDRLISILTADRGRITVLAKGARSMKSKIRGVIQPYTFANFEIAEKGGGIGWIVSGSVTESFPTVRTELFPLSLASYICAVAQELSDEAADAAPLLRLMLNTFYLIAYRADPADEREFVRIKAAFEFSAMTVSGYAPDLSACEDCGRAQIGESYLDVLEGTCLCSDCMKRRSSIRISTENGETDGTARLLLPMSHDVLAAIRYVVSAPPKRVYSFLLKDEEALDGFAKAAEAYLEQHLERTFQPLTFFRSVQRMIPPTKKS